jgi:hypothetical protein
MQANFDKRASSLLRIPCWVVAETLPESDKLQDICKRGFKFIDKGGMLFTTGVVDIDLSMTSTQLVYCELAVGRAYVQDAQLVASSNIPPGYDSFYVPPHQLDRNNDGEFSIAEYQAAANFEFRSVRYLLCSTIYIQLHSYSINKSYM